MSKNSSGLFALIAGVAAGAAALFLSDPKNRQKTERVLQSAAGKAKKIKKEYEANPTAFKKKVVKEARKTAQVALKKASTTSKKVVTAAKKATKKK